MQQFAFRFKFLRARADEKIGCEEFSNRKTGEKFSIVCFTADDDYDDGIIECTLEIKRCKAEEKKGDKNGGKQHRNETINC